MARLGQKKPCLDPPSMVSHGSSDLPIHRDSPSVYQNAKTAAERAFRASRAPAILGSHSHDGRQYQRLERNARSDGQGSHLARSKSLRGPKKTPIEGKSSYQRPRLRMQVSFPKFLQSSNAGTSQPLPSTPTLAERKADSCFLSCHRDDTAPRNSPCAPVGQPQKWEMAQPLVYSTPVSPKEEKDTFRYNTVSRSHVESPPNGRSSSEQLEVIEKPVSSQLYADKLQQLQGSVSMSLLSKSKKDVSKLHKANNSGVQQGDPSNSERLASGLESDDPKLKTFRQKLERISVPFRNLYSRKTSHASSAQSQLPPQHIEARRSHVFSTETIKKLNEAAAITKLSDGDPNRHANNPSMLPSSEHRGNHGSRTSFKLPLNGQHILEDLDGTSYQTSRLTSWAESSVPNTTMGRPSMQVRKDRQAITDVLSGGREVDSGRSSRRLRIPRRKSSISFNKKSELPDSQRVYSALLKRIAGTDDARQRQNSAQIGSRVCQSTGSLTISSQQTVTTRQAPFEPDQKPTLRLVNDISGSNEHNSRATVGDHLHCAYGPPRNDVVSPSIYSGMAFDSVERLNPQTLPRVRASTGTALVSQSQPAAVWTLSAKRSGRASPTPNTSNDWREWTSKAMLNMTEHVGEEEAKLRSFSNPWLVSGTGSGDFCDPPEVAPMSNPPMSRQSSRNLLSIEEHAPLPPPARPICAAAEDEGVDDPFSDSRTESQPPQPRFPSRMGADDLPRRRPITLQSGSPMNERFLKNIRKGPWGIASPDGSPERAKKGRVQQIQPKNTLQDENVRPTGGQQMAEEFLKDRVMRGNSSSPVFL